jgi:hypothetical protein
MRNSLDSLVVAGFAALATLAAGIAPASAEPASRAYPYCAFRAGATSCYYLTRAECGRSCISNPSYVGDARARGIRTGTSLAEDNARASREASRRGAAPTVAPVLAAHARADSGFDGWPTDYLVNRFGDRQAQGRF